MKKILIFSSVMLVTVILSGCSDKPSKSSEVKNIPEKTDVSKNTPAVAPSQTPVVQNPTPNVVPPAGVSAEPGTTPDAEIKNIDKDLQAIDDSAFNQNDLSNASVGL
jgi:PBP1b-binding outer membrane lipoprotein LpoB